MATNSKYEFYPFNYKGLVIADGECAVIRGESAMAGLSGHCGYCVFAKDDVPLEWHGDYNADGLSYLSVQGGLTYCSVHGANDEERRVAARKASDDFVAANPDMDVLERFAKRTELANAAAKAVPYTHVVFGFDCAHYGDENNYALFDSEHVFRLAKVMRQQIAEHARRIDEYRAADEDRRIAILDEIRATADMQSAMPIMSIMKLAAEVRS